MALGASKMVTQKRQTLRARTLSLGEAGPSPLSLIYFHILALCGQL